MAQDKSNLGYLGETFQYRLAHEFMANHTFFEDMSSILDQNMFTDPNLKTFVGLIKNFYEKYGYVPSYDAMDTELRNISHSQIEAETYIAILNKIKEIPGEWNCQIEGTCLNNLKDAKILHYFAMGSRDSTTSYKLRELSVYERIKETGNIPEDILFYLHHPHKAFTDNHLIVAGQTLKFIKDSEGFQKFYKYYPRFALLFLSFFNKLAKK